MNNFAILPGVVDSITLEKKMNEAEGIVLKATKNIKGDGKMKVMISWPGTPLDGHAGTLEGSKDDGSAMVRLDATGGIFSVPGERIVAQPKKEVAPAKEKEAPTTPEPASRGGAPQEEELTKRGEAERKKITEPPKRLGKTKPKAITKDIAKAAPEAGAAIQQLVSTAIEIEKEKEGAEAELENFRSSLNLDLIDERYQKAAASLYEAIEKTSEPVLKIKDMLVAIDVKRDVVEANMSKETQKKYNDLLGKMKDTATTIKALKNEISEIINASFSRMGGTEKETQRVTTFEGSGLTVIQAISQMRLMTLSGDMAQRYRKLEAGLLELFTGAVAKAKEILSNIKNMVSDAKDFITSYDKDLKATAQEVANS